MKGLGNQSNNKLSKLKPIWKQNGLRNKKE